MNEKNMEGQIRQAAAERNGISQRTLYRYEKGYREEGFEGLRPAGRTKKRRQGLPENFERIMEQAVQLKREVPKRSVRQIIKILEVEGWAQPGALKQSTMQRHLYDAGLGKKQIKRYTEKRETSSRRFCRAHRMELCFAACGWQADPFGSSKDHDGEKVCIIRGEAAGMAVLTS